MKIKITEAQYNMLSETRESQKDLELLSFHIMKRLFINPTVVLGGVFRITDLKQSDVSLNGLDFIRQFGKLRIHLVDSSLPTMYDSSVDGLYNTNRGKILIMVHDNVEVDKSNFRRFESALLHELQHAYDDWRSNGKALAQSDEYVDLSKRVTVIKKAYKELSEEDKQLINKYRKLYYNLKHEVDARFTEAIKKTSFYQWLPDDNFNMEAVPYNKCLETFTNNFEHYNMLKPSEKNRVIKRFSKIYVLEKEAIDLLNPYID